MYIKVIYFKYNKFKRVNQNSNRILKSIKDKWRHMYYSSALIKFISRQLPWNK